MPSDTRGRVTDEAVKLFSRKGFADTSVAEIERAAGLKPGAGGLYAHFDSKADLALTAIEAQWQIVRAECDSIFSPMVDPL